jgi:DNA-binding NarL/FixJ family response regulator
MAAGWTNAEIAIQRGATQRSVESMSHRIFSRLGVNDDPRKSPRVEAVKLYSQVFGVPRD